MEYDVNYFIEKFEAIPKEKWCAGALTFNDRHCAFGFCGVNAEDISSNGRKINNIEAMALAKILKPISKHDNAFEIVISINYGYGEPKENIISALKKVRDKEQMKANIKEASKIVNEVLVNQ